jgi:hypothetical protein
MNISDRAWLDACRRFNAIKALADHAGDSGPAIRPSEEIRLRGAGCRNAVAEGNDREDSLQRCAPPCGGANRGRCSVPSVPAHTGVRGPGVRVDCGAACGDSRSRLERDGSRRSTVNESGSRETTGAEARKQRRSRRRAAVRGGRSRNRTAAAHGIALAVGGRGGAAAPVRGERRLVLVIDELGQRFGVGFIAHVPGTQGIELVQSARSARSQPRPYPRTASVCELAFRSA